MRHLPLIVLGLALLCVAGCNDVDILVLIDVSGIPPEARTLWATGVPSRNPDGGVQVLAPQDRPQTQLASYVPAGTSGPVSVTVDAVSGPQCKVATGMHTINVSADQTTVHLPIRLDPIAPLCPVKVEFTGKGAGWIESAPPGTIKCDSAPNGYKLCRAFVQGGLTLVPHPAPGSYFNRWQLSTGKCDAVQCAITGLTQGVVVTAEFIPEDCPPDHWCTEKTVQVTSSSLRAIWGPSATSLWAIGADGTIMRWDGSSPWYVAMTASGSSFSAIWGSSDSNIWAVGSAGAIWRFDGTWNKWSNAMPPYPTGHLYGISGIGPSQAWIVGDQAYQWTGTAWVADPGTSSLYAIWAGGADVWAAGSQGQIQYRASKAWNVPITGDGQDLFALAGFVMTGGSPDVWAVGRESLHHSGAGWDSVPLPTFGDPMLPPQLNAMCLNSPGHGWAVGIWGNTGVILRLNTDSPERTQWWSWNRGPNTMPPTPILHGVFCLGDDVWAVGENGTILRYVPSPQSP